MLGNHRDGFVKFSGIETQFGDDNDDLGSGGQGWKKLVEVVGYSQTERCRGRTPAESRCSVVVDSDLDGDGSGRR